MRISNRILIWLMAFGLSLAVALPSFAKVTFQCPSNSNEDIKYIDLDGDGIFRADRGEILEPVHPTQVCMHLSGGDGFGVMGDAADTVQYLFGFATVSGIPDDQVMNEGLLAAEWPAPTIFMNEGDHFYLTLTNVGMFMRPDLFDPHTVHYHGLPESSNIFDGLPESGISINMGSSLTYYYKINEPGTFMYHCHVEATEHMQMGMLGNLYVHPGQDGQQIQYQGRTYSKFVYNDGDGSTGYDVEYPIQLGGFDRDFHDASSSVQPLPFATMWDDFPMINGRGYPDTVNPAPLAPPAENGGKIVQKVSSLIEADQGDRILLRITNLNVTRFHTIATYGIPMTVVGKDAKILRSATGENLYYDTNSFTIGGGESFDVILDTQNVSPGIYFLYCNNMNLLSNDEEDYGGMMTEIRISAVN